MSVVKKAPRRQERILAFKVLYGLCFSPVTSAEELESAFLHSPDTPEEAANAPLNGFAWELAHGVWQHMDALDAAITSFSQNWRVDRMARVELTLLRIAIYELLYRIDVPPRVAMNEAIELAKQFGDDKSRGFINGILDAAAKALESGTLQRTGQ